MVRTDEIREHMEIIGADGVHVGTVDKVDGDRIKLTKQDSGSHHGHHHYISMGLVSTVEGDKVRLSATGANAALLEEEAGGEALADKRLFDWKTVAIGVTAVAGVAAAAAAYATQRDEGRAKAKPRKTAAKSKRK